MTKLNINRMNRLALSMRMNAKLYPQNIDDPSPSAMISRLSHIDWATGASLIFSFDVGHHTSGWWKNPDYEQCFHLSISSLTNLIDNGLVPSKYKSYDVLILDKSTREKWVELFFDDNLRLIWVEPPYSDYGKKGDTYHYRLFVSKEFIPILPRDEVYTKEFTDAGWKSWSDVHAKKESI